MLTLCYAAKGGSGTTVVTALAGLARRGPTLLIDLDDELPAVLGVASSDRPGIVEWMASNAPLDHLADLLLDVDDTTQVITTRSGTTSVGGGSGRSAPRDITRWMQLASWCRSWSVRHGGRVLIDAGTRDLPDEFVASCDQRWLVTRSCYLSLRAAAARSTTPSEVVLVDEPGRSLRVVDIEQALGAPVAATIDWDPRVARAVDAGLLAGGRLHKPTTRVLAKLMRANVTDDVEVAA